MTKNEAVVTKDKWAIYAMRCCGHVPDKIVPSSAGDGGRFLLYHFPSSVGEDYDDYMRGVDREPFTTIRLIREIDGEFKNNLYRLMN